MIVSWKCWSEVRNGGQWKGPLHLTNDLMESINSSGDTEVRVLNRGHPKTVSKNNNTFNGLFFPLIYVWLVKRNW